MKCQSLFYGEKKIKMSAEFAQRVVKVILLITTTTDNIIIYLSFFYFILFIYFFFLYFQRKENFRMLSATLLLSALRV